MATATCRVTLLTCCLLQVLLCSRVGATKAVTSYNLHHMMEVSLFSNNHTTYAIQDKLSTYKGYAFNNQYTFIRFYNACLTVDRLECPVENGQTENRSYSNSWNFQWTDSVLVDLISGDIISVLDPVAGYIRHNFISNTRKNDMNSLHVHLNTLPFVSEKVLVEEFVNLLTWIKVYAKSGKPEQFDPNDQGFVSINYGDSIHNRQYRLSQHFFRVAIIATYMALNSLLPLILWKTVPLAVSRIKAKNEPNWLLRNIYWAASVAISLYCVLISLPKLQSYYIRCTIFHMEGSHCFDITQAIQWSRVMHNDLQIAFIMKAVIIPLAVLIELAIAIKAWRPNVFPQPPEIVLLLLCCLSPSQKQFVSKTLQVIVLWQFLILIQVLATMVVPCCIVMMVSPFHAVSNLSVIAGVFILLITLPLAYFLHICSECTENGCTFHSSKAKRIKCLKLCLAVPFNLFGLCTAAILILAGLQLYIILVFAGLANDGVKGIMVTLIPTGILTLIVWFVRNRFCGKYKEVSKTKKLRPLPPQESTEDSEDTDIEIV